MPPKGVGLAATQVDVHERVIVMDTSEQRDRAVVLINPEMLAQRRAAAGRGGLPVGAGHLRQGRALGRGHRAALGRDGQPFEMTVDGLAAVCVQHEMDHLLGKVFVEYLSPLKRDRIRTKMLKKTRDEQKAA
jgi:peptide deformylase